MARNEAKITILHDLVTYSPEQLRSMSPKSKMMQMLVRQALLEKTGNV